MWSAYPAEPYECEGLKPGDRLEQAKPDAGQTRPDPDDREPRPDPDDVVARLAAEQNRVVSRAQLRANGVTRHRVRSQIRARRWQAVGPRVVVLHTGPLTKSERWWIGIREYGTSAEIDGVQHEDFRQRDRDRERRNEITADGRRVLNFTSYDIRHGEAHVAETIERSLRTGGWPG